MKISRELYNLRFIFEDYLVQLMHLDNLNKHVFSTYQNDTMIYVSYSIKWKYAEERANGLHCGFKKTGSKYNLHGMFTAP